MEDYNSIQKNYSKLKFLETFGNFDILYNSNSHF